VKSPRSHASTLENLSTTAAHGRPARVRRRGADRGSGLRWGALGPVATACTCSCKEEKLLGMKVGSQKRKTRRAALTPNRGGAEKHHGQAVVRVQRRGLGLGCWGALGHDTVARPPAKKPHSAKSAHRSPRHGARRAHGTAACRGVALGSTRPKAKCFGAHRLTRHGGKGSLRCEVTTWMARFDTPFMGKWRRTGSRRLDGALICRGQGRQAAREERGNDAHDRAVVLSLPA
jgi:hypothetical protein